MNSSASSLDPKGFDGISSASTRHKTCNSLRKEKQKQKQKKIKKKDINGKNVLSRPQAKQTWVPFPLAIYQIGTWIGAGTMALVRVAPQVNSRFNEITFVSSKIIQRTAASWER